MRIFSKKAFQFDHPAGSTDPVIVQAQGFTDVPDWVADSLMFSLASQDGSIEVIGSRADEIAAETGSKADAKAKAAEAKAKKEAEAKAAAELKALQDQATGLQISDVDKLGREELIAAITSAGAEPNVVQ